MITEFNVLSSYMNIRFFVINIVDLLSQNITVQLDGIKLNSSIILIIQIACCVAHDAKIYSAFEDDKDVVSSFFEV